MNENSNCGCFLKSRGFLELAPCCRCCLTCDIRVLRVFFTPSTLLFAPLRTSCLVAPASRRRVAASPRLVATRLVAARVSCLVSPYGWSTTAAALMASPSAGSSRDAGALPPLAPPNAAGEPVDTMHLDRLVEKALAASKSGRYALAAAFYKHAADEALRLHGDTFVCTFLTLQRSHELTLQAQLEAVPPQERTALYSEAWALVSSCLPLIARRLDANTMLPGRGTAVELAFFKRNVVTRNATFDKPPLSTRGLQLVGLFLGYTTAVIAAELLLRLLPWRNIEGHDVEAEAFVLRVVDCMLPAARSMPEFSSPGEMQFAFTMQQIFAGAFPKYDATFLASLRSKWTAAAMVQMRRERNLPDASERAGKLIEKGTTRWRADVAEHGLRSCALPSCDKKEASVQQYKFCSACRSVWYCSEEHGALHWTEHKPVCRATVAAQQAADDAGAGAA